MDNDKSWLVMVVLTFVALAVATTYAYLQLQSYNEYTIGASPF